MAQQVPPGAQDVWGWEQNGKGWVTCEEPEPQQDCMAGVKVSAPKPAFARQCGAAFSCCAAKGWTLLLRNRELPWEVPGDLDSLSWC